MGLVVATTLIVGTVLLAIVINRVREWWEQRRDQRPR
jgi:hypothetical protein